jgi:hypothetical protein
MKFGLSLTVTTDDGTILEHEVFSFAREVLVLETLGLTLDDGKGLLKSVQQAVVEAQVNEYLEQQRQCSKCQKAHRIKGLHFIKYSTVFGDLKLRSPRFHQCDCSPLGRGTKSFSPLVDLLIERCSPELVYLETKWASLLSYGLTTKLIKDVLPVSEKLNPCSIRKHVFNVAERLQPLDQRLDSKAENSTKAGQILEQPPLALQLPDGPLTVGIDGGYLRSQRKQGFFEVIAGKSLLAFKRDVPEEQDSSSGKVFGFVQTFDQNHKHRFLEHLKAHGLTNEQKIVFFSDGGESVRSLQKNLSPNAQHVLDWFHITMRLTVLGQYAKGLPDVLGLKKANLAWQKSTPNWEDLNTSAPLAGCARETALEELESIKHFLWHGNSFRALEFIDGLLLDFHVPDPPEGTRKVLKGLLEFRKYIHNNQAFIVNYGERYRQGERISTAFVESTVNYVLAKRFSKQQSMQWSPCGAHHLLQVRTRVLNGDLEQEFKRWYPKFQTSATILPLVV